ncbi:unnamed protein product, partial [Adineta ricciae]
MSESSKSPLSTTSVLGDISSRKERFNTELSKLKNDSSNNPLFTADRYENTVLSVQQAKKKC